MKTQQVEDIVRSCERYWRRTGVPREAISDMRLELETHLREAVEDGKSLEEVVEDETLFAETWAREFRAPMPIMARRARVYPTLAGLAVGLSEGLLALRIRATMDCCPRGFAGMQAHRDELLLLWITVGVAVLALAGAASMISGRARVAAFLWGVAVVPSLISAGTWLTAILLVLAVIGARRHFARAVPPSPRLPSA